MDMQACFCEPNEEHRESIESGCKAAAKGGFTTVCVHGQNKYAIGNKATVEYILNKADKTVQLVPIGSLTQKTEGNDIAEMFDMQQAGALAFGDYKKPILNPGVLLRALQYTAGIKSVVIAHCNDTFISHSGQMNEGPVSTEMGLKGMPSLAEELMLERNISILEYTGGKLHIPTVNSAGSVELVKKAKNRGLNITAGVAALNLCFDDSALKGFDTNFKTDPPIRSKKDMEALRKGVESGIIDVIVSDHCPYDTESKDLEFDLAEFGASNIQTTVYCLVEAFKDRDISKAITAITINPRKILNLPVPSIKEGEEADITIFSLQQKSMLTDKSNESRSKNNHFLNKEMPGKIIGIIRGAKSVFS